MDNQFEKGFMRNKAIESGKFIIRELNDYKNICILSTNENYPHLTYWIKSLFNYFQYKNFNMEIAKNNKNYDAEIIIELRMGMKKK